MFKLNKKMYENQLEFIKPQNLNSFSGIYYSDLNNCEMSNHLEMNPLSNYENKIEIQNFNPKMHQNNKAYEKYLYIDEKNQILKQNEINNEVYAKNQQMDYMEQLDYMNQHNVNIFPDVNPIPLIYNGLAAGANKKSKNTNKKGKAAKRGVAATWDYNKNFLSNLKNRIKNTKNRKSQNKVNSNKNNIVCLDKDCKDDENKLVNKNFNFNTNIEMKKNNKGLFDPNLKSNELEFPRKTVIQRLERMEKIKNYDVKFGNKVRKLEVYKNIVDMFDDLAFDREEKDFRKKENKNIYKKKENSETEKKNKFNILNYNIIAKDDTEDIIEENIKKYKTNLDFNFSHQEQMIKALEEQINKERKMRVDVNMKYIKKMKELEEVKIKEFIKITAKSLSKSARKSKGRTAYTPLRNMPEKLLKVYLPEYDLIKDENKNNFKNKKIEKYRKKFKNDIDSSLDLIRKQNKDIDTRSKRMKSEEAIKEAMNDLKPSVDRMVENDFKKIFNKIVNKNLSEENNPYSLNKNDIKSDYSSKKKAYTSKNKIIKKIYTGGLNNHKKNNISNLISRRSIDRQSDLSRDNYAMENINNSFNPEMKNRSIIEQSNHHQDYVNNSSFIGNQKANFYSNNEINQNSISLSNNINQSCFKNIVSPLFSSQNLNNNNSILNPSWTDQRFSPQNLNHEFIRANILNKKLQNNPANYDFMIEMIIDELLIENVYDLQEIEEKQEKIKQKEQMKSFIKDYYHNFEGMKKLEENVSDKLLSGNYGVRLNPQNPVMILDGKEDRRHIIYKNPFAAAINNPIDSLNPNSLIIIENESINDFQSNKINNSEKKIGSKLSSNNQSLKLDTIKSRITGKTNPSKSHSREKDQYKNNKKKNINRKQCNDLSNRSKQREQRISDKSPKYNSIENKSIDFPTKEDIKTEEKNENKNIELKEKIQENFMSYLKSNNYDFGSKSEDILNSKIYYTVKLHKNLPNICEKYKQDYDDYMKTTGVFFVPNVFMLYEDVVNRITNEIFEECVSKSLRELDDIALNLIKKEVEKEF